MIQQIQQASQAAAPSIRPYGPPPKIYTDAEIKPRQVIEVRPWEPIYIFVETRMGAQIGLKGLNKHTPFIVEECERPAHATQPRCMGQWYKVSAKPEAKAGKTDLVKISSRALVSGGVLGPEKAKHFTLKVGHVRYY